MMFRNFQSNVIATAVLALTAGVASANTTISATIPGTDAIFLAGRTDVTIAPPGTPPAGYPLTRSSNPGPGPYSETFPLQFSAAAGQTFQFSASGNLDLASLTRTVFSGTPDGTYSTGITGVAGISGYSGPEGALVGVFLTDTNPQNTTRPATLSSNQSFTTLSPGLDQVFFIGDGLTGTGSGTTQTFDAPAGAMRLFIGVADVGLSGAAGNYDDNTGSYSVLVTSSSVPEPTSMGALASGLSILAVRRRNRTV